MIYIFIFMDKKYFKLINYKIAHQIYSLVRNNNHNHLIIYGKKGVGKKSIINSVLKDIDNKPNYFNCCLYSNFYDHLKESIKYYNYYNNKYNYLILDNYEHIKLHQQEALRVLIEKSYQTTRFIIITTNINKVIKSVISRCCCIRIPELTHYDKCIHFHKNDINYHNINICRNVSLYEIHNNLENNQINIYQKLIDKIFSKKITIHKIREICFKIKQITIPNNELLKQILNKIIDDKNITFKKKKDIIAIISEYDILLTKSYRDIIYLESLFIKLVIKLDYIK
jgi:replication-associated recombination protein RarA